MTQPGDTESMRLRAAHAVEGRSRVRPALQPFAAVTPHHPRRALAIEAAPAPIGERCNGAPTDVMLQGFHWTSCASQDPSWYEILAENASRIRQARFDLLWFPPPSESAFNNQGYMPTRWDVLDSAYGSAAQMREAIASLAPVRAIADVVVNHRCGVATDGADFADPAFPEPQTAAVCQDDESGVGTGAPDTGERQPAARDLDHTSPAVQAAVTAYLGRLRQSGFSGWRYDEVRGYAGAFVGLYNDASSPHLSVGEFWDANRQAVVDWIDSTRGKSMAFDFPTRTLLKSAIGERRFWLLKTVDGKPAGTIGWWPAMCVTFLENHDTDKDHPRPDEFGSGDQILQGYAYLLTHPGIPCVFWEHFFDYGPGAQATLEALIAVRKAQGIHRASVVDIAAADSGRYAAVIDGKVAVKIGPGPWDPGPGFRVARDGNDFAVWVPQT